MKTVRLLFNDAMARAIVEGRKTVTRRPVKWQKVEPVGSGPGPLGGTSWSCVPGDLLIGRECWRAFGGISDVRVDYRSDGGRMVIGRESETVSGAHVHYLPDVSKYEASGNRWRSSSHMPDWAARIRRRVVSVTVERVQDITEDDAVREGFSVGVVDNYSTSARDEFSAAWESIYAAKGLGWHINPWVWRIEFGAENVEAVK